MYRAPLLALLLITALAAPAGAARVDRKNLIKVISPSVSGGVPAHPFVNVIVSFGRMSNGTAADPASFRARLNGRNITKLFADVGDGTTVTGKRAAVDSPLFHEGKNRLRFELRSLPFKSGHHMRAVRDVDQLRFKAVSAPNQPPHAQAIAFDTVALPGVPIQFDATESTDPDLDKLTYHWDFGDGTTSDEARPTHAFADQAGDITVQLTVSDGQATATDQVQILEKPSCGPPPIFTPGTLHIEAPGPLEFHAVAPGATATLPLVVRNPDTTPTSQLHARLGSDNGSFTIAPADVTLGPGEQADVTVTFTPSATGHQSAFLTIVACESNRSVVRLLAHGFGGTAPGTGPTLAADPLFYLDAQGNPTGILPNGLSFFADNRLHTCVTPDGLPTGDVCVKDSDCAGAATCPATSTCRGGDNAGQTCTFTTDCPRGFCPAQNIFSPDDMCGDGNGGLYLIAEDTSTDRVTGDSIGTVARLQFDLTTGGRTDAAVLDNPQSGTILIACDRIPLRSRGRVYIPEYHEMLNPTPPCARDEREALTSISKANGTSSVLLPDIDAALGYTQCGDSFTMSDDLHVTSDGSAVFVAVSGPSETGVPAGIYRILPNPELVLNGVDDFFQVHPDGDVLYATATDNASTGIVKIYKVSPDQAVHGAPRLADLTPCATFEVPNNGCRTAVMLAAGRTAPDSTDGVLIVSLFPALCGVDLSPVLPTNLRPHGAVAFASPAGSPTCSVLGVLSAELTATDQLTF